MTRSPENEGASIVMLGAFNPGIFQPRWLGAQGLIRPEEAENAKIMIIQGEVADFVTEWFHLQVLQNRFVVESSDPRQYSPLRDLAMGMFTILPHTPIKAMGLNRRFHFRTRSAQSWHAIGHALAPKAQWEAIMENPGLRSMLMEGRRPGAERGVLKIRVEPSTIVEHGLFVETNEEFTPLSDADQAHGAEWIPACLAKEWEAVLKFAGDAANRLVDLGEKI